MKVASCIKEALVLIVITLFPAHLQGSSFLDCSEVKTSSKYIFGKVKAKTSPYVSSPNVWQT